MRGGGTALDAECDEADWTHAERSENQHQGSPYREVRLSGLYVWATSFPEGWSRVFGGKPLEEECFTPAAESGRSARSSQQGPLAGSPRPPQSEFARLVELLPLWTPVFREPGGRQLRL